MAKTKAKLHAILGGSADEVEAAFYEALQRGDIEQLMACWADEDDIACIRPGGQRLTGAGAIRSAFEALFTQAGVLRLQPDSIRRVDSLASAVHHVVERLEIVSTEGATAIHVLATNVYHKTPQGWRMVVHHASPGGPADSATGQVSQPVLH